MKWTGPYVSKPNERIKAKRKKKRPRKAPPPKENQLFYTTHYLSLCADAEFTTTVSQFSWASNRRKSYASENHTCPPQTLNMSWAEKGSGFSNFAALIISMSKE